MDLLDVAENFSPREKLLLYHDNNCVDETVPPMRQYCRMIGKSEGLPKECRNCKPVGNTANQSRLTDHEHPIRP